MRAANDPVGLGEEFERAARCASVDVELASSLVGGSTICGEVDVLRNADREQRQRTGAGIAFEDAAPHVGVMAVAGHDHGGKGHAPASQDVLHVANERAICGGSRDVACSAARRQRDLSRPDLTFERKEAVGGRHVDVLAIRGNGDVDGSETAIEPVLAVIAWPHGPEEAASRCGDRLQPSCSRLSRQNDQFSLPVRADDIHVTPVWRDGRGVIEIDPRIGRRAREPRPPPAEAAPHPQAALAATAVHRQPSASVTDDHVQTVGRHRGRDRVVEPVRVGAVERTTSLTLQLDKPARKHITSQDDNAAPVVKTVHSVDIAAIRRWNAVADRRGGGDVAFDQCAVRRTRGTERGKCPMRACHDKCCQNDHRRQDPTPQDQSSMPGRISGGNSSAIAATSGSSPCNRAGDQ